jgi:hypothetical protein
MTLAWRKKTALNFTRAAITYLLYHGGKLLETKSFMRMNQEFFEYSRYESRIRGLELESGFFNKMKQISY